MNWIKSQLKRPRTYIFLFVTSLAIPFIINELYKWGQTYNPAYITMWHAEDMLSFFGSYLSFFGTIILGAVALIQTDDANKQTARANQLATQMQQLEKAKFMSIISVDKLYVHLRSISSPNYYTAGMTNPIVFDMVDLDFWAFSNCYHIDILFENISDYPIVEFYAHAKGIDRGANIRHGIKPADNSVYISPHESQAIRFIIPAHFFQAYPTDGLRIDLEFVNVFDFHTLGTITIDELSKWSTVSTRNSYRYQIKKSPMLILHNLVSFLP